MAGSKGWAVTGEAVGVMQHDGRFMLVSLGDGSKMIDAELDPEKSLSSIWVLADPDRYLLVTSGRKAAARGSMISTTNAIFSRHVNGKVYAFDRRTGKPLWPSPAVVKDYAMPPGQPPGIPVLTFLRNVRLTENGRTRAQASVLCIDRRDGRALLEKNDFASNINEFGVTATPEKNEVTIQLNASLPAFRFQFTDQPQDPAPPAQTENVPSPATESGSSRLSKVAEAIADALGRHAERLQNRAATPKDAQGPVPQIPNSNGAPVPKGGAKNE